MSTGSLGRAGSFSAGQVADATGGKLSQGDAAAKASSVGTDSRTAAAGSLFVALKGENFDGSGFCAAAVERGAVMVLVERRAWDDCAAGVLPDDLAVVTVADSLRALGDLAAWHRRRFDVRLVAVTGANGKTSTKEMIAAVLGGEPAVLFNRGNLNNLVGMPRSLLKLDSSHRYAVMEMGMNAPGEIGRLAEVAGPQVGVITNVHPVHLEGLGSIQAVADAKGELLDRLPGEGVAVLNADDPYVLQLAGRTRALRVTFGHSPAAEVRVDTVRQTADSSAFRLHLAGRTVEVTLGRLGVYNAVNAAAAAAVGMVEGLDPEEIAARLAGAPAPPMRMEVIRLGDSRLLADCYNANPRSVQAALSTLSQLPARGPRLALLGDMLELGEASEQLHHQVGRGAAEARLDGLCAFGPNARAIAEGAREAGLSDALHTESLDEALDWARRMLQPGAWLLLKGSRGMRLERIAATLAREHGVDWGGDEEQ